VVPTFWLLLITLLWIFMYKFLWVKAAIAVDKTPFSGLWRWLRWQREQWQQGKVGKLQRRPRWEA